MRARLGQEAARLREQGLSGTYRGVVRPLGRWAGGLGVVGRQWHWEFTCPSLCAYHHHTEQMQEMALATVLRGELEYVVPAGPLRRGSKPQVCMHACTWTAKEVAWTCLQAHIQPSHLPQAADTQLEYAFEALGRAVLAPAGLPSGARVLGLADDVMASIGLAVQEEAAETNWVS